MKTKLFLIAIIAAAFTSCKAQSQTTVYAKNSDISDNLDLRAVASMFGESANLQDFERRLNDPKYQISNLDLNNDDEVDYLRVIESVEDRTHVVIIQAVLDRDVYQDVATIDVERNNSNQVSVQVVGNSYLYGDNYIYEPVYSVAPVIYSSFWVTNYRPYYSSWSWNVYPTYYAAWNPYPIYRYRRNINVCINVNNHYNYVNTRRSYRAPAIYETRRTYGYERSNPNNGFAQRHANVSNRYDLDQRRIASRDANRGQNTYNTNRSYNTNNSNSGRVSTDNGTSNRNYTPNRTNTDRSYNNTNRVTSRDNTSPANTPSRVDNPARTESGRNYSNNNTNYTPRANSNNNTATAPQRTETPRSYSNNTNNTPRVNSNNNMNTNRASAPQRTEAPRNYSENRGSSENRAAAAPRQQNTQRSEAPRASQEQRANQPQRESGSGRSGGGRRG
jgi:hypothetical protein